MGVSAAVAGAGLVSNYMSSEAAADAADQQTQAARENAAMQKQIADQQLAFQRQQYADALQRQQPYLEAGKAALSQLSANVAPGGKFVQDFQFNPNQDPSYAWRLAQGQRAMDASAARGGGLFTDAHNLALMNYGQNAASQEYQNAFNRYQTEIGNQYNRLSGVAGTGQSAVGQANQLGANMASQAGNILGTMGQNVASINQGAANANAAATIAQGNQMSNALNTLGGLGANYYANQQQLAKSGPSNADIERQIFGG